MQTISVDWKGKKEDGTIVTGTATLEVPDVELPEEELLEEVRAYYGSLAAAIKWANADELRREANRQRSAAVSGTNAEVAALKKAFAEALKAGKLDIAQIAKMLGQ